MIPFVGISNWTIDVSKMNRNIYVSRPSPELNDLKETAEAIIRFEMNSLNLQKQKIKRAIAQRANFVAKTYFEFRKDQVKYFEHKNFHSLRDFYWLLKNIGKHMNEDDIFVNEIFMKKCTESILRNFSGYFFIQRNQNNTQKIGSYQGRQAFKFKKKCLKKKQSAFMT